MLTAYKSSQPASQFRNKEPKKCVSTETKNRRNKLQEQANILLPANLQLFFGKNGHISFVCRKRHTYLRDDRFHMRAVRVEVIGLKKRVWSCWKCHGRVLVPLLAHGSCARIASGSEVKTELSCGNGTIIVSFIRGKQK